MLGRIRIIAFALSCLAVSPAAAHAEARPLAKPGQATANYVVAEFRHVLELVRDVEALQAKDAGGTPLPEACFKALTGFDPGTQTEAIRAHLSSAVTPEALQAHDTFVVSPMFVEYTAMTRRFSRMMFSKDGFDSLLKEDAATGLKEMESFAVTDLPEYRSLSELTRGASVLAILKQALADVMPEGCEKPGDDGRDATQGG